MKGTWDDDRDPLAALRRGDPRLFEAFVGSETATFLRFFLRLGAGLHEAEDLVQEVFLSAMNRLHALRVRVSQRI